METLRFSNPNILVIPGNLRVTNNAFPGTWANISALATQEGLSLATFATGNDISGLETFFGDDQPITITFPTGKCRLSAYPQDAFVAGDDAVIIHPALHRNPQALGLFQGKTIIVDDELCEGGRYAFGDEITFLTTERTLSHDQVAILSRVFPGQEIIPVPSPRAIGLTSRTRHTGHYDQVGGGAILAKDGTLLCPVHSAYYSKQHFTLSRESSYGREIVYIPLNPQRTYIFNYPHLRSGKTYIGPGLYHQLRERGYADLLPGNVQVLPHSMPETALEKAGLKCRINFV